LVAIVYRYAYITFIEQQMLIICDYGHSEPNQMHSLANRMIGDMLSADDAAIDAG